MTPVLICHCGRRGPYAGNCYWHAEGLSRHRSRLARAAAKTVRQLRLKLCGNKLHAMTPENTLVDFRGKRCRACKAAADARYRAGLAKPSLRTPVLPYRPKRRPLIARLYSGSELAAYAEAKGEYLAWLRGRSSLDLIEAVA